MSTSTVSTGRKRRGARRWGGWSRVWEPISSVNVIAVVALAIGGWPIFKEAAENIAARRMTMELSKSIAIIAAAANL
jgi:cation transport ATPase